MILILLLLINLNLIIGCCTNDMNDRFITSNNIIIWTFKHSLCKAL